MQNERFGTHKNLMIYFGLSELLCIALFTQIPCPCLLRIYPVTRQPERDECPQNMTPKYKKTVEVG